MGGAELMEALSVQVPVHHQKSKHVQMTSKLIADVHAILPKCAETPLAANQP